MHCHYRRLLSLGVVLAMGVVGLARPGRAANGPLVTAEALAELVQQTPASVRVVDVRAKDAYAAGHIAGAAWADIGLWKTKSLADGGLADMEFWNEQLGALGVDSQSSVVVVGDAITNASRGWWLLRYLGVREVRVLDGGVAAWNSAEQPLVKDSVVITPTQPKLEPVAKLLAVLEHVTDQDGALECTVIDTRSAAEYSGPRGGHIPGATNLEWSVFVDENGKFLEIEKIQGIFKKAGVDLKSPLVTHCQTGARSSVVYLALELAEAEDIKNYYLGWTEYSAAAQVPVEK